MQVEADKEFYALEKVQNLYDGYMRPFDVAGHHEVVDQGSHDIHQQNGQHHAFRVGRVDDTHKHSEYSDENAVDPAPFVGLGCRDRVGGHENRAEGPASQYEMPQDWGGE